MRKTNNQMEILIKFLYESKDKQIFHSHRTEELRFNTLFHGRVPIITTTVLNLVQSKQGTSKKPKRNSVVSTISIRTKHKVTRTFRRD